MKLCECGCGQPAPISKTTDASRGYVKGQPVRFLTNHHKRGKPGPAVDHRTLFESKTFYTGDCIVWCGYSLKNGYGRLTVANRQVLAHRFAYEQQHGPIPAEFVIDHICRNRACVNVGHLRAVTFQENIMEPRSLARPRLFTTRTHCAKDHEPVALTLYVNPRGHRTKRCDVCAARRTREWTISQHIIKGARL